MKIVKQWWKTWSAQLLILANFLAGLAMFLPEVRESLPDNWYQIAFAVILAARIIKQSSDDDANKA